MIHFSNTKLTGLFLVLNKIFIIVFGGLILLNSSYAQVSFGRIQTKSVIGQPLQAYIEVLASPSDAASIRGRSYHPLPNGGIDSSITTTILRNQNSVVVQLGSLRPINDPYLDVVVELINSTGASISQKFTLLINPSPTSAYSIPNSAYKFKSPTTTKRLTSRKRSPTITIKSLDRKIEQAKVELAKLEAQTKKILAQVDDQPTPPTIAPPKKQEPNDIRTDPGSGIEGIQIPKTDPKQQDPRRIVIIEDTQQPQIIQPPKIITPPKTPIIKPEPKPIPPPTPKPTPPKTDDTNKSPPITDQIITPITASTNGFSKRMTDLITNNLFSVEGLLTIGGLLAIVLALVFFAFVRHRKNATIDSAVEEEQQDVAQIWGDNQETDFSSLDQTPTPTVAAAVDQPTPEPTKEKIPTTPPIKPKPKKSFLSKLKRLTKQEKETQDSEEDSKDFAKIVAEAEAEAETKKAAPKEVPKNQEIQRFAEDEVKKTPTETEETEEDFLQDLESLAKPETAPVIEQTIAVSSPESVEATKIVPPTTELPDSTTVPFTDEITRISPQKDEENPTSDAIVEMSSPQESQQSSKTVEAIERTEKKPTIEEDETDISLDDLDFSSEKTMIMPQLREMVKEAESNIKPDSGFEFNLELGKDNNKPKTTESDSTNQDTPPPPKDQISTPENIEMTQKISTENDIAITVPENIEMTQKLSTDVDIAIPVPENIEMTQKIENIVDNSSQSKDHKEISAKESESESASNIQVKSHENSPNKTEDNQNKPKQTDSSVLIPDIDTAGMLAEADDLNLEKIDITNQESAQSNTSVDTTNTSSDNTTTGDNSSSTDQSTPQLSEVITELPSLNLPDLDQARPPEVDKTQLNTTQIPAETSEIGNETFDGLELPTKDDSEQSKEQKTEDQKNKDKDDQTLINLDALDFSSIKLD